MTTVDIISLHNDEEREAVVRRQLIHHEDVVRLWDGAAGAKELEEVEELAVDVATYSNG